MGDITSIQILKTTKTRLNSYGNKTDSYDEILTKLMDFFENFNGKPDPKVTSVELDEIENDKPLVDRIKKFSE